MNSLQVFPQERVEFGRRWAGADALFMLALLFFAAPVAAEESWRVRVDCPELDAEAIAQLEVRHLVELQGLPGAPKTMVLSCGVETLEGKWERNGEVLSQRSVTRTPNDDLLELAHWMASVLIGVGSGGDSAEGDSVAAERAEHASAHAAEPAREAVAQPRSADSPAPEPAESESRPSAVKGLDADSSSAAWDLGLGAGYQHYGTQVPGSLGPVVQGTWGGLGPVGVGGSLGYYWGLRSAAGLSLEEGVLTVHARIDLLNWLGVLAGPSAAFITFRGSQARGGGSEHALGGGGELLVRAEMPKAGWGPFVALGLRVLLPEQRLRLDGETVLELPALRGGLTLGLRYKNRR